MFMEARETSVDEYIAIASKGYTIRPHCRGYLSYLLSSVQRIAVLSALVWKRCPDGGWFQTAVTLLTYLLTCPAMEVAK